MKMKESQFLLIKEQLKKLTAKECFYKEKLEGVNIDQIQSQEDFEKLPFTWKGDLREAYPLGLMAEPEEKIVRIHSSSGTTGTPVIIPYTQQDVDDWALMFKRCYEMAGITNLDRIQITPGYGLWTAGIGFQMGAERLGAMTVPMGPGNTDKQLRMMMDMKSTVLCATSSYALLLAEEIAKRGIGDKICLRKGVIGSERWGDKMRRRIANELGVDLYDIYGLTEVYGPGIAINCQAQGAMHYWDDYIYLEIVDPKTGEVLPDGEVGEMDELLYRLFWVRSEERQQTALLRLSLFDCITPAMVDALLPAGELSREEREELFRRTPLVRHDAMRDVYYPHELLLRFLGGGYRRRRRRCSGIYTTGRGGGTGTAA